MNNIEIRQATKDDIKLILQFIKELAEYEKMLDDVETTEEILYDSMVNKQGFKCLLAYYDNIPVGMALYFYNFSTFTGKRGLYLEDLYVKEEYRNKNIGRSLLKELVNICKKEDLQRFEWWCLNWNKPSIDFYKRIGATSMDEWTTFRLDKNAIDNYK